MQQQQGALAFEPPCEPLPPELEQKYQEWRATKDGQAVYREVVARARLLRSRGLKRYGLAAIWEAIRYDRTLALAEAMEWRLNNSWRAFIAREIESREPDLDGFFAKRESMADKEGA